MAFLKRANGETAGQIIELKPDRIIIGRSPEHCHVVLDPNGVSRRHAEIYRKAEESLSGRSQLSEHDQGQQLQGHSGNRSSSVAGRPDQYLRRRVPVLPATSGGQPLEGTRRHHDRHRGRKPQDSPHLHTLDASRSSAMASMVKPEVKLKAILEIARNLSTELKIDTVAPKILDSLMELFPQAERLFLVLVDPETKRLIRKAFKYRPAKKSIFSTVIPADEIPMSISRSIVNHVLGQKKAVLSQDAGADKNLPTCASIADLKIRSVMCVPLLTPDREALGIIQLDTSDRKQFHQEDLDVLAAVAGQAAIAIQNAQMHESLLERERVNRDLKLAEQVQKRFLAPVGAGDPRVTSFSRITTRPTRSAATTTTSFRCRATGLPSPLGDVSGKGRGRRAHDGQVFR